MASEPVHSRFAFHWRALRWRAVDGSMSRSIWPAVLMILLGALTAIQTARLLWAIFIPLGPVGNWQPVSTAIMPMTERQALFAAFDPFFPGAAGQAGTANVTALGLTLFGTNMNEATGGGSAIIAGADGVQTSFAVGDDVVPGVKLAGVAFDHVLLDHGGAREALFLDQSTPALTAGGDSATPAPTSLPPPTPEIGSAPVGSGELSPASIRAGFSFAPRSEGGRVTGLIIQPKGDGAVLRAAGLRPGDVVRSVNGRPIGSAADASAIASLLSPGARLSFEVERAGSITPVTLFLSQP